MNLEQRAQELWKDSPVMQKKWIEAVKSVRASPGWRHDLNNQPPMRIPTTH